MPTEESPMSDHQERADGTDTPATEWFGQNVDSDAETADRLTDEHGTEEAERRFEEEAHGSDVEERRRGDEVDPDLGRPAYREERPQRAADADDPDTSDPA